MRRWMACAIAMMAVGSYSAATAYDATPPLDGYAVWLSKPRRYLDPEYMRLVRLPDGRIAPGTKTIKLAPVKRWWDFDFACAPHQPLVIYLSGPDYHDRLHLVDLRHGTDRVVGTHDGYIRAIWSPDARYLAAVRGDVLPGGETRKLSVIDLKTGAETELGASISEADFTPDGKALVFAEVYYKGRLAGPGVMDRSGAPPGTHEMYSISLPPGAKPKPIEEAKASRLIGDIYPTWRMWFRKMLGDVSYEWRRIGMVSCFSPDRSRMMVAGLEPNPESVGMFPTLAYYPSIWGILDRKGNIAIRFRPGIRKTLRGGYENLDYLGWSPDGKRLYVCIPKPYAGALSYMVTVDTRTGKVRRQRLRWMERRGGDLLAYYPKEAVRGKP